jgi:arylsulfatase A-like enzyme
MLVLTPAERTTRKGGQAHSSDEHSTRSEAGQPRKSVRPTAEDNRPNIVLIYADDLGYGDLGCYGNDFFETPNIDSLIASGLRFTNAYSTAPLCAPSRVALLSGLHNVRAGCYEVVGKRYLKTVDLETVDFMPPLNRLNLPKGRKILPEYLKELGYFTGFFGKWHVGPNRPTTRGFDEFVETTSINSGGSHLDVSTGFKSKTEGYPEPKGYSGDYLTACAQTFLDRAGKARKPFFLYLAHTLVHIPLEAKEELVKKYREKEPTPYHHHATYAAMVENLDTNVGTLMDELKRRGLLENTLVIFTSDNGGATGFVSRRDGAGDFKVGSFTSNYPLRGGKCQLFEGGIRVPMAIAFAGQVQPAESDGPVTQLDLLPTILDVAGYSGHVDEVDGRSLKPILDDPDAAWPERSLFWHYPGYRSVMAFKGMPKGSEPGSYQRPASAVRRGDWKLIESLETGQTQLFNLRHDIAETKNVASQHREIVKSLTAELRDWRKATNAPMPTRKTDPSVSADAANRPPAEALFKRRDGNKDGFVTLEEYIGKSKNRNVPALTRQFNQRDANKDGKLSLQELKPK